jgi:hypothetical protein
MFTSLIAKTLIIVLFLKIMLRAFRGTPVENLRTRVYIPEL